MIDLGGKLVVLLLGHPEVRIGDRPVTLPTRKALLLLAILLVEAARRGSG